MSQVVSKEHFDKYLNLVAVTQAIEVNLSAHLEWACVTLFYAAVHLVNSYLVLKPELNFQPSDAVHTDRDKTIRRRCPELQYAKDHYRDLKDLSVNIRYVPGFKFNAQHLAIAKTYFSQVKSIVEPMVKRKLGLP